MVYVRELEALPEKRLTVGSREGASDRLGLDAGAYRIATTPSAGTYHVRDKQIRSLEICFSNNFAVGIDNT